MSSPIIITGMHRSGTSLVAELLNKAGLYMGEVLDINYESPPVTFCNERLMMDYAACWDNPLTFKLGIQVKENAETSARKLHALFGGVSVQQNILADQFSALHHIDKFGKTWGMKDPRFIYTLPLWQHQYPEMKVIHIHRHGVDVAQSLSVRAQEAFQTYLNAYQLADIPATTRIQLGPIQHSLRCTMLEGALSLWEEYESTRKALIETTDLPHHVLCYEELVADPAKHIDALLAFCELEVTDETKQELASIPKTDSQLKYMQSKDLQSFAQNHADLLKSYGYAA